MTGDCHTVIIVITVSAILTSLLLTNRSVKFAVSLPNVVVLCCRKQSSHDVSCHIVSSSCSLLSTGVWSVDVFGRPRCRCSLARMASVASRISRASSSGRSVRDDARILHEGWTEHFSPSCQVSGSCAPHAAKRFAPRSRALHAVLRFADDDDDDDVVVTRT